MPDGTQRASSVLQRYMNRIFLAGLCAAPDGLGGASGPGPVALATGPLGRCVVIYFDDILVFSPTKEQHLLDVAETLEILKRNQLYAASVSSAASKLHFWGTCCPRTGLR